VATIVLPGIGGSGETHWQTLWERHDPTLTRFQPSSWDNPDRADWIDALDRAVACSAEPPLLVAHSLACLLVAHWAAGAARHPVRGAFMVAVPDPAGAAFPDEARSFAGVPTGPLPFPTMIVASTDDPYATLDHVRGRAAAWGADLVVIGAAGHINGASGLGAWSDGRRLFEAFRAGLDA